MFDHTIIYMTVTYQGLELNNCILGLKIWKRPYYIEFGLTCTKSGNQARIEIISTNQMQDKKKQYDRETRFFPHLFHSLLVYFPFLWSDAAIALVLLW